MAAIYRIFNGPAPTVAAQVKQATGTAIRTMLQLAPKAAVDLKIKAWGLSFDSSVAGVPGICELIDGDVAATVLTAHATADIAKVTNPAGPAADTALITLGTGATGFSPGAGITENSITSAQMFDAQLVAPTNQYVREWSLGSENVLRGGRFLRIRCTFAVSVGCICWIEFEG